MAVARAAPRASAGHWPNSTSNQLRQLGGTYCPARPSSKTMHTGAVARVAEPPAPNLRNMSNAISKLEARKSTQPAHTAWKSKILEVQGHAVVRRTSTSGRQVIR